MKYLIPIEGEQAELWNNSCIILSNIYSLACSNCSDVIKLEEGIGDKVSALVYSLTIGLGCIVMSMVKGWKLALLCLTTTPVTFMLVGLTGKVSTYLLDL